METLIMTRSFRLTIATLVLSCLAPFAAQATEQGCRFFLCIQDPGWRSNGECPPTVIPILSRMKWGIPPPPCPEAGWNGRIGYERYQQCPAGSVAGNTLQPVSCNDMFGGSNSDNNSNSTITFTENMCVKPPMSAADMQRISIQDRWKMQSSRTCGYQISDRPLRADPRYMDYSPAPGKTERVWFNY
jgi:hypothetical protein